MVPKIELQNFLLRNDLPLVVVRSDLNGGYPEHTHDSHELVVVVEGRGRQRVNGQAFDLEPGMVFLLKDEERHSFEDCRGLIVYNALAYRSTFETWLAELAPLAGYQYLFHLEPGRLGADHRGPYLTLDHGEILEARRLLESMEREQRYREDGFGLALQGLFLQLATLIMRRYRRKAVTQSGQYNRIAAAIAALHQDYCRPVSIAALARACHLSERQFLRVFRDVHGVSPTAWILRQRLAKARVLLAGGGSPVGAVASDCGFPDSNYFARAFRRAYGQSPTQARASRP